MLKNLPHHRIFYLLLGSILLFGNSRLSSQNSFEFDKLDKNNPWKVSLTASYKYQTVSGFIENDLKTTPRILKADLTTSPDDLIEVRISRMKFDPQRLWDKYRVLFDLNCVSINRPDVLELVEDRSKRLSYVNINNKQELSPHSKMFAYFKLKAKNNGVGAIKINFWIQPAGHDPESAIGCGSHTLTINFDIRGVIPPPPPPTLCDKWQAVKNQGFEEWRDFIKKNPNDKCVDQAKAAIAAADEAAWQAIRSYHVCSEKFQEYIKTYDNSYNGYRAKYINEALGKEEKCKKISADKKKREKEKTAWNNAKRADTIESYNQFIDKYPSSDYKDDAEEAILRLSPLGFQTTKFADGSIELAISNGHTLSYQEVILNPSAIVQGLIIHDERFPDEHILKIEYDNTGAYSIVIYEREWKKDSLVIPLDNLIFARVQENKSLKRFNFLLRDGIPPYQINAVDVSSNSILYTEQGIRDSIFFLPKDSLKNYLQDAMERKNKDTVAINFRFTASDSKSIRPMDVAGGPFQIILPPATTGPSIEISWQIWLLSGIALMLIFSLITITLRRRRKREIKLFE